MVTTWRPRRNAGTMGGDLATSWPWVIQNHPKPEHGGWLQRGVLKHHPLDGRRPWGATSAPHRWLTAS